VAGSGQARYRLAGTLGVWPASPSTAGRRGRILPLSVKAEPGRACATYEFEPGGGGPVRPSWNAALRRTLCVEARIMEPAGHSPPFTGSTSSHHRHICAFFNSIDEQHRVLRPFIKDGFNRGGKAYHYVDPELREEHLSWLADAGVNVPEAMGTGQLEVQPWQDS